MNLVETKCRILAGTIYKFFEIPARAEQHAQTSGWYALPATTRHSLFGIPLIAEARELHDSARREAVALIGDAEALGVSCPCLHALAVSGSKCFGNAKPDKEFLKNFGDELRAIAIAAGARKTPARKQQPERSRPMSKRQIAKELSIPVKKLDAMTEQGHYKMWKLSRKTFQIRVDKLAPEQRLALL
jgi:hypothetical protein